jgi:hypothetical protein
MHLYENDSLEPGKGLQMENTTRYSLQLRFVGLASDSITGNAELEVLAHPEKAGQPFQGKFQPWEPVFEDICTLMQSSAFHRKAIQRTLSAGLPAHLINRETGDRHMFSAEDLAGLSLLPVGAGLDTDLSTAA